MADHEQLVAEMETVSKLSVQERLLLAKRRRLQQLECYERQRKLDCVQQLSSLSSSVGRNNGRKCNRKTVAFTSRTKVFEAAARNDADEVRSLLKSNECEPNSRNDYGFTILHQCCIDSHLDLIRSLIEDFGSSVNLGDDELWTPLHTVALCGRSEVSRLLIDHGADLMALNIDGNMPYDICDDEETLDVIEAEMSKRGITQEQIEEHRMTKERQMLKDLQEAAKQSREHLEHRGRNGETPLHVAAANGYLSVAKLLLESMVTVDPEDNDFWQPIHCAAKWRQLPVLELLIVNGAELTSLTRDGRTPLDLCDDPDIQSWMKELRREVEAKKTSLVTSHQRLLDIIASKSSVQMQTSGGNGSNSQLYSSNMSLAEGAKTSSSHRHLPSSAKESIAKRSAEEEESNLCLSLQSLSDGRSPPQPQPITQRPSAKGLEIDISKVDNEQLQLSSAQNLQKSQMQIKSRENTTPIASNDNLNYEHNSQLKYTKTIEANGQPKPCLRTTNTTNHSTDELNRKRRIEMECCVIS